MQDFIGQRIVEGSWLAAGGAGNTKAEYGMILYRVSGIDEGAPRGLKLQRLRVTYPKHTAESAVATVSKVSSSKGTKYVVVKPKVKVTALFERVAQGNATRKDHQLVGRWLHGQTPTEGLFG